MAPKVQKKKPSKGAKASSAPPPKHSSGKDNGEIKSSLLPSVVVAVVAILTGVLTPPALHAFRHQDVVITRYVRFLSSSLP